MGHTLSLIVWRRTPLSKGVVPYRVWWEGFLKETKGCGRPWHQFTGISSFLSCLVLFYTVINASFCQVDAIKSLWKPESTEFGCSQITAHVRIPGWSFTWGRVQPCPASLTFDPMHLSTLVLCSIYDDNLLNLFPRVLCLRKLMKSKERTMGNLVYSQLIKTITLWWPPDVGKRNSIRSCQPMSYISMKIVSDWIWGYLIGVFCKIHYL